MWLMVFSPFHVERVTMSSLLLPGSNNSQDIHHLGLVLCQLSICLPRYSQQRSPRCWCSAKRHCLLHRWHFTHSTWWAKVAVNLEALLRYEQTRKFEMNLRDLPLQWFLRIQQTGARWDIFSTVTNWCIIYHDKRIIIDRSFWLLEAI